MSPCLVADLMGLKFETTQLRAFCWSYSHSCQTQEYVRIDYIGGSVSQPSRSRIVMAVEFFDHYILDAIFRAEAIILDSA